MTTEGVPLTHAPGAELSEPHPNPEDHRKCSTPAEDPNHAPGNPRGECSPRKRKTTITPRICTTCTAPPADDRTTRDATRGIDISRKRANTQAITTRAHSTKTSSRWCPAGPLLALARPPPSMAGMDEQALANPTSARFASRSTPRTCATS